MKLFILFLGVIACFSILLTSPRTVYAEDCEQYKNIPDWPEYARCIERNNNNNNNNTSADTSGICNPLIPALCGSGNAGARFGGLISALFGAALLLAGLFAFVNLVIGGINWITSGGDKGQLEAARSRIQNALIGLFIVASAWAIMLIVEQFFGISILRGLSIPTLFGQ